MFVKNEKIRINLVWWTHFYIVLLDIEFLSFSLNWLHTSFASSPTNMFPPHNLYPNLFKKTTPFFPTIKKSSKNPTKVIDHEAIGVPNPMVPTTTTRSRNGWPGSFVMEPQRCGWMMDWMIQPQSCWVLTPENRPGTPNYSTNRFISVHQLIYMQCVKLIIKPI